MSNSWFRFKQFTVQQDRCAMKVTTDACLFGAWAAGNISDPTPGQGAKQVLDIGTGTGLLSLMLAQQGEAETTAIEIDKDASEQAAENVLHSPWKERINVVQADARSFAFQQQYDVVISNPPFYENELRSADNKKNIAHHSHHLNLDDLFGITRDRLTGGGTFYFLLPFKRKTGIEQGLAACSLFIHEVVLVSQSAHHDPFRLMIRGGLQEKAAIKTTALAIRNEQQQYTPAFTALLKDYYLDL